MITLPKKIHLTAMKAHWKVSYVRLPGKLAIIERPGHELIIYGHGHSKRDALDLILRWIQVKAYYHLSSVLRKVNRRIKANYKKLIIRSQSTRWGSYSSTRTISLNYQLMFLPAELVRHLAVHELCHGHYQSHAPKFWHEVAKYDKNWRRNNRALVDADAYIPPWVIS